MLCGGLMKSAFLLVLFGFGPSSTWAQYTQYQSQNEPNYYDARLDKRKCSGRISDLNCYEDIIKNSAHRQNVMDGSVQAEPTEFQGTSRKAFYQGQQIMIDTQDQRSCEEVKKFVTMSGSYPSKNSLELDELCEASPERYRTITMMWETSEEYVTPIKLDFLKSTENTLGVDSRNLTYLLAAGVGLIWLLPESVSKWDRDEIRATGLLEKWKRNVSQGPVIDQDDAVVNYVGHPLSGAAYYTLARSSGHTMFQSFGYSVVISTFFWEYGVEAFAEKPSIQDLIITPVLGSILGEFFYRWTNKIEANGGKVLGSKRLGSVILFVFNPAKKLSGKINSLVGRKVIQNAETNFVLGRKSVPGLQGEKTNYIGFELKFKF